MSMDNMTIGEQRVRVTFNPSAESIVDRIKQKSAELINLCEELKEPYSGGPSEKNRLCAVAQTDYETACMYAVKAATASIPVPALSKG